MLIYFFNVHKQFFFLHEALFHVSTTLGGVKQLEDDHVSHF